jgi:hypothetical protein
LRVLADGDGANTQKYTAAKANLLFQNKGNVISVSYDTNQTIWMVIISLFEHKR